MIETIIQALWTRYFSGDSERRDRHHLSKEEEVGGHRARRLSSPSSPVIPAQQAAPRVSPCSRGQRAGRRARYGATGRSRLSPWLRSIGLASCPWPWPGSVKAGVVSGGEDLDGRRGPGHRRGLQRQIKHERSRWGVDFGQRLVYPRPSSGSAGARRSGSSASAHRPSSTPGTLPELSHFVLGWRTW